ncbi:hypothetical protein [Streptomyces sp. NPDC056600]|uniref:hypothetical protein n=1 Tax=Streptomyces sp. NPDC056600 TaxID=3345874 RepID=UPI0036A8A70E
MHHIPYPHRSEELLRAAEEYRLAREAGARGRISRAAPAARSWPPRLRLRHRPPRA